MDGHYFVCPGHDSWLAVFAILLEPYYWNLHIRKLSCQGNSCESLQQMFTADEYAGTIEPFRSFHTSSWTHSELM
ncbi:hypothetical protein WAI453_000347 [Rhynchosporium graminicola]